LCYLCLGTAQTHLPTDKVEVSAVRNANDIIAYDVRDC